jgi:hypothetical protein
MIMPRDIEILNYMQSVLDDHIDPITGKINCTALAEDAFHELADRPEISERYFELAFEVAYKCVEKAKRS